jgi:glycosyltransferase involved in cell wall biosynthesis
MSKRAQKVVVVSQAIAEKVREILQDPAVDLRIIPNGIDTDQFQKIFPKGRLKKELAMEPGDPLIASIGSLSMVKNQQMLLAAAVRLVPAYPTLRLILVGEGPYKNELEDFSEKMGLTPFVHFLGLRKDVPEILSETDIFVSTSRWEGLPLAILEAMAAGKPIVATAVPGVLEVLAEETGVLVPLEDNEALTRALCSLIDHPGIRLELGLKARERVVSAYNLKISIGQWEALYEELICGDLSCPIK